MKRSMSQLTPEDKQQLLRLARETLRDYLRGGELREPPSEPAALVEPRATFVTLWEGDSGDLRGCRGEPTARRPLAESVVQMAIAAATDDPRFPPVTIEELADLRIEISALTPLQPIRPGEVEVGRHGLMIIKGARSGLLLPHVPVRYGWDREKFLIWTCRKAGLPDDAWQEADAALFGFETESWGEAD